MVTAAAAEGGDAGRLAVRMRQLAEEACEAEADAKAKAACQERLLGHAEEAIALADALAEGRRERGRLRAERADILAVGFQTTTAENQEFASLVVCATAGIFAVSVHWSFFSVFGVSYALYRRSTKEVRKQRAAVEHLEGVIARLKALDQEEAERLEALRARARAWDAGSAE